MRKSVGARALAEGCGVGCAARLPGEGDAGAPRPCRGAGAQLPMDAGSIETTIHRASRAACTGRPPTPFNPTCCQPQLLTVISECSRRWGRRRLEYAVEMPCAEPGVDAGSACQDCALPCWGARSGAARPRFTDAGPGGITTCVNRSGCGTGRPPRGFVPRGVMGPSAIGRQLAWMAQLEAASVVAFQALNADLARLGAPASLLRSVLAAAQDEVRHARRVAREAARRGVGVPSALVAPIGRRSIEDLAIDNAEEGCVRETFGAALVAVQADRATDPRVRALMRGIAADELRHAALSWRIARWLEARLDTARPCPRGPGAARSARRARGGAEPFFAGRRRSRHARRRRAAPVVRGAASVARGKRSRAAALLAGRRQFGVKRTSSGVTMMNALSQDHAVYCRLPLW